MAETKPKAGDDTKKAEAGAKKLLGINSPSRVFAEIGGHTMDGLHVGLENRYTRVAGLMRRISKGLIQPMRVPNLGLAHAVAQPMPSAAPRQHGHRWCTARQRRPLIWLRHALICRRLQTAKP